MNAVAIEQAAKAALNGTNDTLFLAIHDRLHRAPATVEECVREIEAMSHHERVCYGAQDYSDDTKHSCPRCHTEFRGAGFCDSCKRAMQEGRRDY